MKRQLLAAFLVLVILALLAGSVFAQGSNPYISGVHSGLNDIYTAGLAEGNQSREFCKVGDSISEDPDFLYPVGNGAAVWGVYGSLRTTARYFGAGNPVNAFNRVSMAALWGATTQTLLDPSINPVCEGRSPLQCEYYLNPCSTALIMIGTNDAVVYYGTPIYRQNLEAIVQATLDYGIIPVLFTIPKRYNIEDWGIRSYVGRTLWVNDIIRDVAHQYQIPLVDARLWYDLLPNSGLSADLVHLSSSPNAADFTSSSLQYGDNVHNLLSVQVLDALRRVLWSASTHPPIEIPVLPTNPAE